MSLITFFLCSGKLIDPGVEMCVEERHSEQINEDPVSVQQRGQGENTRPQSNGIRLVLLIRVLLVHCLEDNKEHVLMRGQHTTRGNGMRGQAM